MEETNPSASRRPRRSFDSAYKLHVARMVREQGLSIHQVCRDLDLSTSAVRQWVRQLDEELAGRPGTGRPLTPEQQRIRELETKLRQLQSDYDLLKKVSALFAREMK